VTNVIGTAVSSAPFYECTGPFDHIRGLKASGPSLDSFHEVPSRVVRAAETARALRPSSNMSNIYGTRSSRTFLFYSRAPALRASAERDAEITPIRRFVIDSLGALAAVKSSTNGDIIPRESPPGTSRLTHGPRAGRHPTRAGDSPD